MPLPYPDDVFVRIRQLELQQSQLMSAIVNRAAFNKIEAGPLQVGSDAGRRIVLNPDGADAGSAEMWLFPDGVTDNPTKLASAELGTYPGEAVFTVTSGEGSSGASEFRLASGEVFMRVLDSIGGSEDGGYAYWGADHAQFGFINGSTDNYFHFSSNSVSRHFGQWDDFGSVPGNAGILCGSWSLASGFSGVHISYPTSMDSNMGPVAVIRDGAANPNFYWALTASTTSGFDIDWSLGGGVYSGKAGYFWSFRH